MCNLRSQRSKQVPEVIHIQDADSCFLPVFCCAIGTHHLTSRTLIFTSTYTPLTGSISGLPFRKCVRVSVPLPFGLSLSPRVFVKFIDAAVGSLRRLSICIAMTIDDWLIVASTQQWVAGHSILVTDRLVALGFRINLVNSVHVPCQPISLCADEFSLMNAGFGGWSGSFYGEWRLHPEVVSLV